MKLLKSPIFELIIWTAALVYLALYDPFLTQSFSFCPLHNAGFTWCPGCGLGRAISFTLHGDVRASFSTHLLGIPALFVLLHRILQLIHSVNYFKRLQRTTQ